MMRKWCFCLGLVVFLGTLPGCEQSSAPAGGGAEVRQPPGVPTEGPEAAKTKDMPKAKH